MTLGFRGKVLLALVGLAGALAAAALLVTQRAVATVQRASFEEGFQRDVAFVTALQTARLALVRTKCLELARSVRLIAAIDEGDAAILYRIALDELREVVSPPPDLPHARAATFFRLFDAGGRMMRPDDRRAGLLSAAGGAAPWERQLAAAAVPRAGAPVQEIGYLAPDDGGARALDEIVLTRIIDPVTARPLGALAIGFPMRELDQDVGAIASMRLGLWVDGRLYSDTIPATAVPAVEAHLDATAGGAGSADETTVTVEGVPQRVFVRTVATAPGLPAAMRVGLYSLADAIAAETRVRRIVVLLGIVALLCAIAAGVRIARGLTEPVGALVAGVREIERGRFDVAVPVARPDELGRLAAAFNEMAAGLALKERYRRVLDQVTDKRVADELLAGRVTLGGELRDVSILFCDVCGFTALTEPMAPADVIAFLNEHMASLTEIVHAHGGVVDKFIGDAVMAVFGAPTSAGDDAASAVAAARAMLAARRRLNRDTGRTIGVHVGIATGTVVAGCMGSTKRLDYTVLGARVNLAARLCGQAGPMEVVIDDETRRRLGDVATVPLPPLRLKGFRAPVAAHRIVEADVEVA